jgi:hypothetical protein
MIVDNELRKFVAHQFPFVLSRGSTLTLVTCRNPLPSHFFSGSLAIVFLALDGMSLAHKGIEQSLTRCQCTETHTTRKKVMLLVVFRVVLIVFFGTLSQYVIEPDVLAFLGFVGIVCQLLTRILGSFLFPPDKEEQEDAALERVANYLSARIR